MRVLVLGWEYPPRVAGGLGAACQGLTLGLARASAGGQPVHVTLAVPALESGEPAAREPGVERVEIPLVGGVAWAPLLSPYGAPGDAGPEPVGAASGRAGAQRSLYGAAFSAALDAYTRGAVQLLGERRGAFDVIHAHDWMTVPAAMQLRMALGVPVCLHVHSTAFDRAGTASADGPLRAPRGDLSASIEAAGVRAADRVIAVSAFTADVIARGYGVARERIAVVHNAPPHAAPAAKPAAGGPAAWTPAPDAGQRTVLFVGRLTRQKGASFFLRAAAEVARARDDVRFVVVGDGEERARLVEEAAALGLARRVFFTGAIDDAARDALYGAADVYVMTSLSEPFGLTPLEALAGGAAVILPRRAGVAEALPSAPAVDPWDRGALSAEILRLLGDDGARRTAVAEGLREAAALDWDASGARLAQLLEEAGAA